MEIRLRDVMEKLVRAASVRELRLPAKLSYAVAKNLKELEKEYELIEEKRLQICERNALKDDEGKPVTKVIADTEQFVFENEEAEEANRVEIKELMETTIDLPIHKVEYQEIERCHESERYDVMSVEQQLAIDFMVEG